MGKAIATKKKKPGTALVSVKDRFAQYAKDAAEKEKMPGGSFMSLKAGVMAIGGNPVKGNSLEVVILDNIFENTFYEGKYDPDNVSSPMCYALARDEEDMKPHETAEEPQHEACFGCPQNEYGTADTGRGKACKNSRRLALIAGNKLTAEVVRSSEIIYLRVPVTSVKGWAYFVKAVANQMGRPPFGVITEISVVPDAKSQFKLTFSPLAPIEDEDVLDAIEQRRETLKEQIMFPYSVRTEEEKAAARRPVRRVKPAKRRKY